jgi:hypothetical protein
MRLGGTGEGRVPLELRARTVEERRERCGGECAQRHGSRAPPVEHHLHIGVSD